MGMLVALGVAGLGMVIAHGGPDRHALYAWNVPVSAEVLDADTGLPVPGFRAWWSFDVGEETGIVAKALRNVETHDAILTGVIRMTHCQWEGGLFDLLNGEPQPHPSMYAFTFEADGFAPKVIHGRDGVLERTGPRQFRHRLPPVVLDPQSDVAAARMTELTDRDR
jgi:hypothetical protein